MSAPDFDALRAERNARVERCMMEMAKELGWKEGDPPPTCSFDPEACYCACPDGPCEHDFQGWQEREVEGGVIGETVCTRCGMGAMSHSRRVGP